MEKNGKNGTFFYKEWKRTERMKRSFEKNGCPTLLQTRFFDPVGSETFVLLGPVTKDYED